MARQEINIGQAPNDGTGDSARAAFLKTNQNFTELYTLVKVARIPFNYDDLINLHTTPKLLVPEPGAGKIHLVTGLYARFKNGATPFSGGTPQIKYGTTGSGLLKNLPAFINGSNNIVMQWPVGQVQATLSSELDNKGIYLWVDPLTPILNGSVDCSGTIWLNYSTVDY